MVPKKVTMSSSLRDERVVHKNDGLNMGKRGGKRRGGQIEVRQVSGSHA